MKLCSFDIEIYNELDTTVPIDFTKIIPSVAATCTCENDVIFYYDEPHMSKSTANKLVDALLGYDKKGYPVWGWNTTAFDLPLLAYYADRIDDCAELALRGFDGMLYIVFNKGHFLGLDTALIGAGLETKNHHVKLNSGEEITDMGGAKAPEMWRNGEYEAVRTYLRGDVIQPLKLAEKIIENNGIRWTSKSGKPNFQRTSLVPTKDLFKIQQPDISWMSDPKPRKDFVKWIPQPILKKYKINLDKI